MSFDWEAELADPVLEFDGVPAILIDRDGAETPLTVLFSIAHQEFDALGQQIDADQVMAKGKISALRDASANQILVVDGKRWLILRKPQSDGRVWTVLHLGESALQ